MKKLKTILLSSLIISLPLVSGCNLLSSVLNQYNNASTDTNSGNSSSTGDNTNTGGNGNNNGGGNNNNEPTKVTIAAHTLKDKNPPIDVNSIGEVVSEETWDSFKYGSADTFKNNYNYTYSAYSGGYQTIEAFTKNGYYMMSSVGRLYYERKSGSTFYQYISTSEGYLRQETTLDIQSKYVYRLQQEIYVHMFEFEDYEYDEDYDGMYRYFGPGFTSNVKFQNGYLTYLFYILGSNIFEIKLSFETTIDIPEYYYYK